MQMTEFKHSKTRSPLKITAGEPRRTCADVNKKKSGSDDDGQ